MLPQQQVLPNLSLSSLRKNNNNNDFMVDSSSSSSLPNLLCQSPTTTASLNATTGVSDSSCFEFFPTESSESGLLQEVLNGFLPKPKPPEVGPLFAPPPAQKDEFLGFETNCSSSFFGTEAAAVHIPADGVQMQLGDIFHYQEALNLFAAKVHNA